ncbi:MAG: hypothetical protein U5K53_08760 [Halanaerobiales bacterium]|nr:hypothetical protein [Halanaerobiales bacterium]
MKLAENFIFKPNKTQQIILGCLGYAKLQDYIMSATMNEEITLKTVIKIFLTGITKKKS